MADTQGIAPADLLIDEENPRISEPNAGQNRALKSLAEHLGPKLVALAADIVVHGTDPGDLPIVMPLAASDRRFLVLEGNRRLAALRVLENPDSVSDAVSPAALKQLRKLSKDYQNNPIDQLTCVVVKDREAAKHWIELRHTGENSGAGRVPWGSDEAARFRSRAKEIHSQALDFLQRRGDLTPEARRKVPASSLKRLLETPEVRTKVGIEAQKGELCLLASEERVAAALMYVVNDLASGKTKVGQIYTKTQRQDYAKALPASVVVKTTAKSGQGTPVSSGPAPAKKPTAKGKQTKKRDRLIPRDCVLAIPGGRINDIEDELRRLSLEDHANAVSVLFRVFVELSVDSYLEASPHIGVNIDAKLRVKIEKVSIDLESKKKLNRQQGRAIRSANMDHSFLAPGVNTMNDYVHNEYIFPAAGDLRAHWNSLQPFITAIWTP